MYVYVVGLNHHSAPVAVREKMVFSTERTSKQHKQLCKELAVEDLFLLSTCNRTEIYGYCESAQEREGKKAQTYGWIRKNYDIAEDYLYFHDNAQAVEHLIAVGSGIDSMVIGEPQIFGQLKQAYASWQVLKTDQRFFENLMQHVFSVTKKIRTNTEIGTSAVSVAYAAIQLMKRVFEPIQTKSVLLIGAGETIELCARHLVEQGISDFQIANRTVRRADALAEQLKERDNALTITQHPLSELHQILENADIVISSTASPVPIIGKGAAEYAIKQRKHNPQLYIDLGVPRDMEVEINEVADLYLYNVDDLESVVEEGQKARQKAAQNARLLIKEHAESFIKDRKSVETIELLADFRKQTEQVKSQALKQAQKALEKGKNAEDVLEQLAHQITQKYMHQPTIVLKGAAKEENKSMINAFKQIFGISK